MNFALDSAFFAFGAVFFLGCGLAGTGEATTEDEAFTFATTLPFGLQSIS